MNLDMTLREFFELSERMAAAARVIRESQAALGAPLVVSTSSAVTLPASHPEAPAVTYAPHPVVQWSPEEQALRARLKAEREAAAEKAVLESRQ